MRHLLLPGSLQDGQTVQLTGDLYHYMARVRRAQVGDRLSVRDEQGAQFAATVARIEGDEHPRLALTLSASPQSSVPSDGPAASASLPRLHLLLAVARGPSMDSAMRQATELGVTSIVPFVGAHSPPAAPSRAERWQRVVRAASQQSGAPPPQVGSPVSFAQLVATWDECAGIVCATDTSLPLVAAPPLPARTADVAVVVGPEGDLSPGELGELTGHGFVAVSLGSHVLRVDTAVVSALAGAWQWLALQATKRT